MCLSPRSRRRSRLPKVILLLSPVRVAYGSRREKCSPGRTPDNDLYACHNPFWVVTLKNSLSQALTEEVTGHAPFLPFAPPDITIGDRPAILAQLRRGEDKGETRVMSRSSVRFPERDVFAVPCRPQELFTGAVETVTGFRVSPRARRRVPHLMRLWSRIVRFSRPDYLRPLPEVPGRKPRSRLQTVSEVSK